MLANAVSGASSSDLFVARLSAGCSWTQAVRAGGSSNDYATTVVVDAQGRAYVGGMVDRQGAQFGPLAIGARAGSTGFVAQLGGLPTATRSAGLAGAATLFPVPVRAGGAVTLRYELGARATVRVEVRTAAGPPRAARRAAAAVRRHSATGAGDGGAGPGPIRVHLQLGAQHVVRALGVE